MRIKSKKCESVKDLNRDKFLRGTLYSYPDKAIFYHFWEKMSDYKVKENGLYFVDPGIWIVV
jgi:hypothetical protein